jgi:hypothetical protein
MAVNLERSSEVCLRNCYKNQSFIIPQSRNPFYPVRESWSAVALWFFDMCVLSSTAAACVNETYAASYVLQRDLDIRGQLETLTSRLSGKIRNVTCVMQELGYVSVDCFLNISEEMV